MKRIVGLVLFGFIATANAAENTCMQLAYNYGLTTNAQVNCDFKYWNDEVTKKAGVCYAMAEKAGKTDIFQSALKSGLKDFNDKFKAATDKKEICNAVLEDFPDYVKN